MDPLQPIDSRKLIVTGSSGFVGRHFVRLYGGVSLDDEAGIVDLCDAARVGASIASLQPQAVLHLAAQSSVASSFRDPSATFAVNFIGTLNLLQALSAIEFKGVFLYVGSADVYGKVEERELPTRETQPLRPRSPYAVSKVAAEALCYQWSLNSGFRVVLTRPFSQIGPGQDPRFAIADFARQVVEIRDGLRPRLLVTGDLDVTRDFMDVRDTVRAYRSLLSCGESGVVYNVCSGQERSLRSVVNKLLEIAEVEAELKVDPQRIRQVEQRRMVGDPSKIAEHSGWKPEISLEQTLADILTQRETN